MIEQVVNHLSFIDAFGSIFVATITGINVWLFAKITNACSKSDVKDMIEDRLGAETKLIETKIDNLSNKIDQFIRLVMKDAHLKIGN